MVIVLSVTALAQNDLLIRIMKAEDERRWDTDLKELLSHSNVAIRKRAALAVGRIGNEDSVSALSGLLQDANTDVRAMAAFAIGEVEAAGGANPLLAVLKNANEPLIVRARALEGLGKIAGALPREQEARRLELGVAIVDVLKTDAAFSDRLMAILGLTAALRARPANAGPAIAKFLTHPDARVRADAGNTLARLRLNDGNEQLRKLLTTDADPVVRANAARVLGATEDKASFVSLLELALDDPDSRVRVSAIRALALLKDARAAEPLLIRGGVLAKGNLANGASETNEVLEIATTLSRLLTLKGDMAAVMWLYDVDRALTRKAPEIELAIARIKPDFIVRAFADDAKVPGKNPSLVYWGFASTVAAALGEIANLPASVPNKAEMAATAEAVLRGMLLYRLSPASKARDFVAHKSEITASDVLRAFAGFKSNDLAEILLKHFDDPDVIVRGTAADLLGDLAPSEQNTRALIAAFPRTAKDPLNDAALSILDALGKQKSATANDAIKTALDSRDYLVRRRAVSILKTNGVGDFSSRIGTVQTRQNRRGLPSRPRPLRQKDPCPSDYDEGFVYYGTAPRGRPPDRRQFRFACPAIFF